MALVRCRTCSGSVSTNAATCPYCGEPDFLPVVYLSCPFCKASYDSTRNDSTCPLCRKDFVQETRTLHNIEICQKCMGTGYFWNKGGWSGCGSDIKVEARYDSCGRCFGTTRQGIYREITKDHRTGAILKDNLVVDSLPYDMWTKYKRKCRYCGEDLKPDHSEERCAQKVKPQGDCYVVTATYGNHSRQSVIVRARCRRTFLLNPFLTLGWCIYKFYGPILAGWSQTSSIGYRLGRIVLAKPIVGATGKR
jgi:hypothetical protein